VTSPGYLARLGFIDPVAAAQALQEVAERSDLQWAQVLLTACAASADPDQALRLAAQVLMAAKPRPDFHTAEAAHRLAGVLGASEALGHTLVRHPDLLAALDDDHEPQYAQMRDRLLAAVGAALPREGGQVPVACSDDLPTLDALRVAYRRELLGITWRDLGAAASIEQVTGWLSDLADATLEAGLAVARAGLPEQQQGCRLAVIGMGKCGGRELNYVSDVDVLFVAASQDDDEATLSTATSLASGLIRACGQTTAEGSIWQVDAALRPEGKQGALVRTLASHVGYYERWAKTWEFQALLKARPSAGDLELGRAYVDAIAPMVWQAAARPGFVADVQAMRRRVEAHIPTKVATREIKLGAGGLRDVEFSVQLLQLVHGRDDVLLRSGNTLAALEALATWGYVGRDDAATMAEAYRFLRSLEHRLQLQSLQRTHVVPQDDSDLRRVGRSLGYRSDPVNEFDRTWRGHARQARRLHEKLFYRPLLQAVARLDEGQARLTAQAAGERLHALGYTDPTGALRHLEALTGGVSRRAAIQRTLLPVLLGWFADGPAPDDALLGFRRVSDALGATHWYLRLLRDESAAAERLAGLLTSGRFATDLLLLAPESVALLADDADLSPRDVAALNAELLAVRSRHADPEQAVAAIRAVRRRELLRIAAARVLHLVDQEDSQAAMSALTQATISAALASIHSAFDEDPVIEFAVIGMGRFGGAEQGIASDADVMFVYRALPHCDDTAAANRAARMAEDLRGLLAAPSGEPAVGLDADLRPEGRQGPLVRSLASYAAYYERWSAPWEAQALLRARPIAGSAALGQAFVALVDPLRYPQLGISASEVTHIRRIKARMEAERLPRGTDPTLHSKLGRGGLSDVEWVVQLMQMQHGARLPTLQTTGTLPALSAAEQAGLLATADAEVLREAWLMASAVRDGLVLARGRGADVVPTDVHDLAALAHVMGYPAGQGARLLEDYRRTTRRARQVMERLFYDD
jgi:glutamate-ammonia-ligase adenylyltransferase